MGSLKYKKVCVTGGSGFLGSYIVNTLREHGCLDVVVPDHKLYDLRRRKDVCEMYGWMRPNVVIHAAASCGGILACSSNHGKYLYDNLTMGCELIEGAREHGVEKFVALSSVCAYPRDVEIPAQEKNLWNGYPEITNSAYGIAKRVLLTACQAYRKQYGLNAIGLIPVNLYGPKDTFDPARSHAIAALIWKCVEAKKRGNNLVVWGTGTASREFLHAEDCAEAIVLATEKYDGEEPINIGTGIETTLKELVSMIVEETKFTGEVVWDTTKPDGQPRRLFDVSKAEQFGFKAKIGLKEGIRETVKWYMEHQCSNQEK